jgi:signal transduction histidine kinase
MSTPVQLKLDDYKVASNKYTELAENILQTIERFDQPELKKTFLVTQTKNQQHDQLFLTEVIPSMNANQRKKAELGIIKMARIVVDISDNNQNIYDILSDNQKLFKTEYEESFKNLFWVIGLFTIFAIVIAIFATSTLKYKKLLKNKTDELTIVMKTLTERERNKALATLVSGVSHELNTPLGNAVMSISFISKNIAYYEKLFSEHRLKSSELADFFQMLNESIKYIDNSIHNATALVNSFKKIISSTTEEHLEIININNLIEDLISICKLENSIKHHLITIDCPKDLMWNTYPESLSQVLMHLINNSVLHAFKNTKVGHINITVLQNKEHLLIEYSDDGVGMTLETQERIFDPFFTTTRGSRAGLGLSIVFNIVVEKLLGTITCSSTIDKGTIFRIELTPLDYEL